MADDTWRPTPRHPDGTPIATHLDAVPVPPPTWKVVGGSHHGTTFQGEPDRYGYLRAPELVDIAEIFSRRDGLDVPSPRFTRCELYRCWPQAQEAHFVGYDYAAKAADAN